MRGIHIFILSLLFPLSLAASTTTVTVSNFMFSSNSITVNIGDTVHWTNSGGFHSATSDGGSFNSGPASGAAWTYDFVFSAAGAFPYYCVQHGCCGGAPIGSTMNGVVNVAPVPSASSTVTPTPTSTPTFSSTGTETPSVTVTDTFTSGPSPTESETFTESPTFSESPTATETPTITVSFTGSPTFSASPTLSSTATQTPTFTETATCTPGSPVIQLFDKAPEMLMAPNPLKVGETVCLYSKDSPAEAHWDIYNTGLQRVAHLSFNGSGMQCWDTKTNAPGLYYVNVEWVLPDAKVKRMKQKVVLWR